MDLDLEIACPNCDRKVKLKLRKLTKGSSHPCPHCGTRLVIADDEFRKAKKALDDFERGINNI